MNSDVICDETDFISRDAWGGPLYFVGERGAGHPPSKDVAVGCWRYMSCLSWDRTCSADLYKYKDMLDASSNDLTFHLHVAPSPATTQLAMTMRIVRMPLQYYHSLTLYGWYAVCLAENNQWEKLSARMEWSRQEFRKTFMSDFQKVTCSWEEWMHHIRRMLGIQ